MGGSTTGAPEGASWFSNSLLFRTLMLGERDIRGAACWRLFSPRGPRDLFHGWTAIAFGSFRWTCHFSIVWRGVLTAHLDFFSGCLRRGLGQELREAYEK